MRFSEMAERFGVELLDDSKGSRNNSACGYSGLGICPFAYEGCGKARDRDMFEKKCSRLGRYIDCTISPDDLEEAQAA